jgi:hypothetical protein
LITAREKTFCLDFSKDDEEVLARAKSLRICLLLHTNFKCCAQDAREIARKYTAHRRLHILRGGGTSDNLDQLTGNGSLSGTVVENLESVDHVTSVLGGVVHGVAASRLLTSVTLGKSLTNVSKAVLH